MRNTATSDTPQSIGVLEPVLTDFVLEEEGVKNGTFKTFRSKNRKKGRKEGRKIIIQTKAIKVSSGADKTANHIFYGDKNEHIDVLEGSNSQMKDAMRQTKHKYLKYGFHHFKISPKEKLTNEQLRETINKLAQEYKFNPEDITLIEHTKKRADTTASDKHYHLIVPHYQPTQCKALDTKNGFS